MNYFELFDIPAAPVVERVLLSKRYFELQKKYHPDFYTQSNENEKENALQHSADINNAYTIFQNSDKTLEYFLQLTGTILPGEKYELHPDFLMEMMELNEDITDHNEGTPERVSDYMANLSVEIEPLLKNFTGKAEELKRLQEYYYKKKYLKRILERLVD